MCPLSNIDLIGILNSCLNFNMFMQNNLKVAFYHAKYVLVSAICTSVEANNKYNKFKFSDKWQPRKMRKRELILEYNLS